MKTQMLDPLITPKRQLPPTRLDLPNSVSGTNKPRQPELDIPITNQS